MLRGCILALGLYLGLATAYYFWLDRVFDPPGSIIGAGVMGLVSMLSLGALINAKNFWRQSSLADDARHDLPWSDGRMAAVSGTIHPLGEPLLAPFSGGPCVLCEYDVKEARLEVSKQDDAPAASEVTGFLMNPCVVRTRMGDVRLLGYPHLEGFPEVLCSGYRAAARARDFIAATSFEDASGLKLGKLVSALKEVWTDDDGVVQKHLRITRRDPRSLFPSSPELDTLAAAEPPESELAQRALDDADDDDLDADIENESYDERVGGQLLPRLFEKRVDVGEPVTAFGIYSAEKRGLVPRGGTSDPFIRLLRGRAEESAPALRMSAVRHVAGGLIALAAVHGIAYGAMHLAWNNPDEQSRRQNEVFTAARESNLPRLKKLHSRGVDIKAATIDGYTALHLAEDPAVAQWLVDEGADLNHMSNAGETPLMFAARQGRTEIVRLLIAAGTDLSIARPDDGKTARMLAEEAGHAQIAEMLRQAEATAGR